MIAYPINQDLHRCLVSFLQLLPNCRPSVQNRARAFRHLSWWEGAAQGHSVAGRRVFSADPKPGVKCWRSKSVIYAASCFGSLRFLFSPHATTICSSQLRSARLPCGWHPRVVGAVGIKRNRNAGQIGQVAAKVLAPDGIVGIVFL